MSEYNIYDFIKALLVHPTLIFPKQHIFNKNEETSVNVTACHVLSNLDVLETNFIPGYIDTLSSIEELISKAIKCNDGSMLLALFKEMTNKFHLNPSLSIDMFIRVFKSHGFDLLLNPVNYLNYTVGFCQPPMNQGMMGMPDSIPDHLSADESIAFVNEFKQRHFGNCGMINDTSTLPSTKLPMIDWSIMRNLMISMYDKEVSIKNGYQTPPEPYIYLQGIEPYIGPVQEHSDDPTIECVLFSRIISDNPTNMDLDDHSIYVAAVSFIHHSQHQRVLAKILLSNHESKKLEKLEPRARGIKIQSVLHESIKTLKCSRLHAPCTHHHFPNYNWFNFPKTYKTCPDFYAVNRHQYMNDKTINQVISDENNSTRRFPERLARVLSWVYYHHDPKQICEDVQLPVSFEDMCGYTSQGRGNIFMKHIRPLLMEIHTFKPTEDIFMTNSLKDFVQHRVEILGDPNDPLAQSIASMLNATITDNTPKVNPNSSINKALGELYSHLPKDTCDKINKLVMEQTNTPIVRTMGWSFEYKGECTYRFNNDTDFIPNPYLESKECIHKVKGEWNPNTRQLGITINRFINNTELPPGYFLEFNVLTATMVENIMGDLKDKFNSSLTSDDIITLAKKLGAKFLYSGSFKH